MAQRGSGWSTSRQRGGSAQSASVALPQLPCSALGASGDTIIVGVDGTERSQDALALAELLAGAAGGRLLIAHVHNYGQLEGLVSGGEYETLVRQVAENAAAAGRELLGDQRAHDMRLVAARSPAAGLQDLAARSGIADRRGVVSPLFRGPRAARRGGPAAAGRGADPGRARPFGLRRTRAATGYGGLRVRRAR